MNQESLESQAQSMTGNNPEHGSMHPAMAGALYLRKRKRGDGDSQSQIVLRDTLSCDNHLLASFRLPTNVTLLHYLPSAFGTDCTHVKTKCTQALRVFQLLWKGQQACSHITQEVVITIVYEWTRMKAELEKHIQNRLTMECDTWVALVAIARVGSAHAFGTRYSTYPRVHQAMVINMRDREPSTESVHALTLVSNLVPLLFRSDRHKTTTIQSSFQDLLLYLSSRAR